MGGKFFGLFVLMIGAMLFYYFYNHSDEFMKNLKGGFNIFDSSSSTTSRKTKYKNPLDDIIISTPTYTPLVNQQNYLLQQPMPQNAPNENYVRVLDQDGRVINQYQ